MAGDKQITARWALITGASRGIGRELALGAARAGLNVIVHSSQLSGTESLLPLLQGLGVEAVAVAADLADPQAVQAMAAEVSAKYQVDILFNNAGTNDDPTGRIFNEGDDWRASPEQYFYTYAVNVLAPALLIEQFLPQMLRNGYGRIINTTSGILYQPCAYACSKAALDKLTLDFSPRLLGTGVTMNVVDPGWIRTDLGGAEAPNDVSTVLPGMLVGAFLPDDVTGKWIAAQDFTGLTLADAITAAPSNLRDIVATQQQYESSEDDDSN